MNAADTAWVLVATVFAPGPAWSGGLKYVFGLTEKVRIEIGVSDHFVEPTVRAILDSARTGEVGDGKIFVLPVERVVRIRTGEEDTLAVTPMSAGPSSE